MCQPAILMPGIEPSLAIVWVPEPMASLWKKSRHVLVENWEVFDVTTLLIAGII